MSEERPGTPPHTPGSAEAALARIGAAAPGADAPARIGPYVPLGVLGGGGMGRVYLAKPADDGPDLAAVKVIRPEYAEDAEFRRRFRREADVHGRVRTPYAPALLGTGFQESLLWTATEYLPGIDLADAVRGCGTLGPAGVWRLTAELGRALAALGTVGIVHRDLKPSNVVVSARGGGGHGARAHVIDFGISQAADSSAITSTGGRVGTPAYMAPEYLREGRCDAASDVFSLAGTLVYAATGRGPFGDGTGVDVMHRVAFEEPRPEVMAELAAYAPELADLLAVCLSKSPAARPTPQQLVDAATARHELARVWPEPLHSRLLERERACEVLRNTPVAATRRLPAPPQWGDAPPAPAVPGYGPYPAPVAGPDVPDAYGPHTPPGGYEPPAAGDGGTGGAGSVGAVVGDGPRRKRRTAYLVSAAAVAVCAVALTAFLLTTRPGAGPDPAAESPQAVASAAPESGGEATASAGSASPSPSEAEESAHSGADDDASETAPEPGDEDGAKDGGSASGGVPGGNSTTSGGAGGAGDATPDPTPTASEQPDPPWISQCTYYSGTELTRYGDSGSRVVQVQCMLTKRGYGVGDAGVDGQFGDSTLAAVKRFQSAAGLTVDGDVGPRTWSALRSRS